MCRARGRIHIPPIIWCGWWVLRTYYVWRFIRTNRPIRCVRVFKRRKNERKEYRIQRTTSCTHRTISKYSLWVALSEWLGHRRINTRIWNVPTTTTTTPYGGTWMCITMTVCVSLDHWLRVYFIKCENLLILMNSAKWRWAALKIDICSLCVWVDSLFRRFPFPFRIRCRIVWYCYCL